VLALSVVQSVHFLHQFVPSCTIPSSVRITPTSVRSQAPCSSDMMTSATEDDSPQAGGNEDLMAVWTFLRIASSRSANQEVLRNHVADQSRINSPDDFDLCVPFEYCTGITEIDDVSSSSSEGRQEERSTNRELVVANPPTLLLATETASEIAVRYEPHDQARVHRASEECPLACRVRAARSIARVLCGTLVSYCADNHFALDALQTAARMITSNSMKNIGVSIPKWRNDLLVLSPPKDRIRLTSIAACLSTCTASLTEAPSKPGGPTPSKIQRDPHLYVSAMLGCVFALCSTYAPNDNMFATTGFSYWLAHHDFLVESVRNWREDIRRGVVTFDMLLEQEVAILVPIPWLDDRGEWTNQALESDFAHPFRVRFTLMAHEMMFRLSNKFTSIGELNERQAKALWRRLNEHLYFSLHSRRAVSSALHSSFGALLLSDVPLLAVPQSTLLQMMEELKTLPCSDTSVFLALKAVETTLETFTPIVSTNNTFHQMRSSYVSDLLQPCMHKNAPVTAARLGVSAKLQENGELPAFSDTILRLCRPAIFVAAGAGIHRERLRRKNIVLDYTCKSLDSTVLRTDRPFGRSQMIRFCRSFSRQVADAWTDELDLVFNTSNQPISQCREERSFEYVVTALLDYAGQCPRHDKVLVKPDPGSLLSVLPISLDTRR